MTDLDAPQPLPNEPSRFSHDELNRLLEHCERYKASDITIQSNEPVFAEINGRLYRMTSRRMTSTEGYELLNAIYGANGMAQVMSGKDVDTHYEFRPSRFERYRYRVNGTACQVEGHEGLQLTLRSIPTTPPPLDQLALEPEILEAYAPAEGVVYVTGATGSGKSTLLASMIRSLIEAKDSHRKVLTYESPIEFVYDAILKEAAVVSQSEIPRHLPSFAAGVRNALRRKPGLILVGEARDSETITSVLEAALTGHPVYTTLHTNGVSETIRRLVNSFSPEERHGRTIDILETIRLVIWQRLVPSVDGKRVALREFLVFDESVRDRLLSGDLLQVTANTRQLLKEKGQTLLQDARRKLDEGRISQRTFEVLSASSVGTDKDAEVMG